MNNAILFVIIAFIINLLGGLFAVRFKEKISYLFPLSAGALLGIALFDLIPESREIFAEQSLDFSGYLVVSGFLLYLFVSRIPFFGHKHKHDEPRHIHSDFKASSIVIHSIIDGVAIGTALSSSFGLGIAVLFASLIHRFTDGMNIVNIIYGEERNIKKAMKYLISDCFAPVLGVLISLYFSIGEKALGAIIAVLGGAFVYIALVELMPESIRKFGNKKTFSIMAVGLAFVFVVIESFVHTH